MKEYEFEIGGIKHTFQLTDKDAEARGLDPAKDGKPIKAAVSPLVKQVTPANKAATAENK